MELPISIIIPTFNEEKYLPKLLKSIHKQTLLPKEIIVVDAFSQDNTRKIARQYGCKVVDGGLPAKARNLGAKASTQPILLFLDADVVIPTRFLERTLTEMTTRELDITSCYVRPMSPLRIDSVMHKFVNYYFNLTKQFYTHIPGACIFVSKKLHKKIKGFDESLVLGEEHDYVKRAKKIGKFGYLNSYKIPVSVRRMVREGRLKVALRYIAIELHLIFLGKIRKDIFDYKLGNEFPHQTPS